MIIELETPFEYEDVKLTAIELDLKGKITPRSQVMLENTYKRTILRQSKGLSSEEMGMYHSKPMLDNRFILMVFEWLTGLHKNIIINDKFPIETYNVIIDTISYFFINWKEPSTDLPEYEDLDGETIEASSGDYGE